MARKKKWTNKTVNRTVSFEAGAGDYIADRSKSALVLGFAYSLTLDGAPGDYEAMWSSWEARPRVLSGRTNSMHLTQNLTALDLGR